MVCCEFLLVLFCLVGAGSAGCVMAHRLTESGKFSVLLLEAGENDMGNYIYDIPGYTDKAVRTHADWGYHTEPQKHAYKAYKNEVTRGEFGRPSAYIVRALPY